MAKKRVNKGEQDSAPFGPNFDNRIPGELVIKLTRNGEMAVTESIASGPIRRAAGMAATSTGMKSLDAVLTQLGVQSINKIHGPIPPTAASPAAGVEILAENLGMTPGVEMGKPQESSVAALAHDLGATYRLRLPQTADLVSAAKQLSETEGVAEVGPNYYRWVTATPNDPMLSVQWGLTKINAPAAWDKTKGAATVVVAVVDTGVDLDHPDLAANLLPGYDAVDISGVSPATGWHWDGDYLTRDNDPQDEVGHGTHVAGTIAAVSDNGTGVAGVTWNCKILPVKVLARMVRNSDGAVSGSGSAVDIAFGIKWAADHGAHIINLSLGGSGDTFVERDAVAYAQGKGVLVVAAMGNDDVSSSFYPAAYPDVIAVGAINQNDQRVSKANTGNWWGSNMGAWIDVVAPGLGIRSTVWDNAYGDKSGTSMAAPHVSGVAALVKSCKPSLTAAEIADILRATARPLKDDPADPIPNDRYGYGLVDAKAAVDKATGVLHCAIGPDCGIAPIQKTCPSGPVCLRLPIKLECTKGPTCARNPVEVCLRTPICLRLPIQYCQRLPLNPYSKPEPGPVIGQTQTTEGENLVPVVVMVPESQVAQWAANAETSLSPEEAHQYALQVANEAYYSALEKLGVAGEYTGFPGVEGSQGGSFAPKVKE